MRILLPFQKFAANGALAGLLLFITAFIAFIWANSPWHEGYFALKETHLSLQFADWKLDKPLEFWINDLLMAVFFLLVGLEIKRELLIGELSNKKKASLAIFCAIGGMIVPTLIYLMFNPNGSATKGFGVPMATDIAFALGVLSLFGNRVPFGLKVLLTAIAIVDDLGAILVIAIFYTSKLNLIAFLLALTIWCICWLLNFFKVRNLAIYGIAGLLLWYFTYLSGLHATIAGVLLAFTIPLAKNIIVPNLEIKGENSEEIGSALENFERKIEEAQSPLHRFEHGLQPYVTYLILPLFALFNGGIALGETRFTLITLGILLGLVIGKPFGIVSAAWLAVRLGLAQLPTAVNWRQMLGLGALGGIGFTMALFIADLAFDNSLLNTAKIGILIASLLAPIVATILFLGKKHTK